MNINKQFQNLCRRMLHSFNLDRQASSNNNQSAMSDICQKTLNTLSKQLPTIKLKLAFENALVDSEISNKQDLMNKFKSDIDTLKTVSSSKSKIKKANKAIKRIKATQNNLIGDASVEWYKTPVSTRIKLVKPVQVSNLLEQMIECSGASLLPSELTSKHDIQKYKETAKD